MGYASGHRNWDCRGLRYYYVEGNGATIFVAVIAYQARVIIDKVLLQAGMSSGLWISSFHSLHAVAIAGTHALINALFAFISTSETFSGVFAMRLPQLGCAFHTPLMQPIEKPFKAALKKINIDHTADAGTLEVRVMSTVDSTWLNRPLDSDYLWDNVLCPTRFGDIVQDVAHDEGDNVVLLEIPAHPAMKTCVEQYGVRYVGLIQRSAPDASVDGSNESLQLLEAFQHLCDAGFRRDLPLRVLG